MHLVLPPLKAHTPGPQNTPDRTESMPGSPSSVPVSLPTLDVSPHTAHAPLPPPPRVPTQPRGGDRAPIPASPHPPAPPRPAHPTAQDSEESPRPVTTTSPHHPITPSHANSSTQDRGPARGQWWRRWTDTQLWELRRWARAEPTLKGLVHRPRKGLVGNCRLQPAEEWMPQAAWEAILADALHPQGVDLCNLPAPQDHPYVLRQLRETLQETERDSIRLWDITQSSTLHTHTTSPPHKR